MKANCVFCRGFLYLRRGLPAVLLGLTTFLGNGYAQSSVPENNPESSTPLPMASSQPAATPLAKLVKEAEKNSPRILAAEHGWQAATHEAVQMSAWPDTQFSVQHFSVGSPRPFAGYSNSDFAYIGVGVSQEIPYPGKRGLRAQVADRLADSSRAEAESVRRQVAGQLKATYFRLAFLQQTLDVLRRNDRLLSDVEQVVESRYRVGHGSQQEVLKAQLQHTKILQEITMHHREEGQLEAQLKQLLNRTQDTPDIVTESLTVRTLSYTAVDLLKFARQQNSDIHARGEMLRKAETQIDLAHKDFRPDFNVQYMYEHNASQFKDYYVATLSLNLPNRKRHAAELAEAVQVREQANQELQAEIQARLSEIQQQYVFVQTSSEELKTYREGLIPQTQATFQSALTAYQANREDFEILLSSFMDVLNTDVQYQRELADHESALAQLETLTGVTLP